MTPPPSSHATIIFKNGIQLSGIVISWSDQKAVLRSITGKQTIVIQNTLSDILFYKFSDTNIEKQFVEVADKPIKTQDDIRELADLKNEINELDRQEISEKLRSHEPSGIGNVVYGSLPIAAIKLPQHNTSTQSRKQ